MFEHDIVLYIEPPFSENPRNGKLLDYVRLLSSRAFPSILTNLTENPKYAATAALIKKIRSDFSVGIIQQARCQLVIVSVIFKYTTFRYYKKSQVQLPAAKASTGISMKTPQCLLPLTTVSKGDTLTEFFVHESDNEFAAITAYSLAYLDVSHSFVQSLQIAIYQNGPQAIEQPSQNLTYSFGLIGISLSLAPTAIVRTQSAYRSSNPLKFTLALAIAFEFRAVDNPGIKLSYSANLSPGIVINQQIQHDYAIELVSQPLAPNGANVYLYPSLVKAYLNTSDIAEQIDIQSECQTRANFQIQSLAEKLINKILGGIKKVADWDTPTLHKVMGTLSGPFSILHPGAGQIMGTIGNIACGLDRHLNKR
ncbi:MAG: hypothetical protein EZS28_004545 [Streblomastix strix]|uniref:Uncharacterized protein n=1 Tax=Streblomastix strix TaxID=222440 RepID=A0A5J4WXX4_9EUKA|nr:MAG: hypothetical protein EZS28_004545 [Streblomastix strix]